MRGIVAIVIFNCSFNYLNPFLDKIFYPYERYQRMVVTVTLIYTSWLLFMLHQVIAAGFILTRGPNRGESIWVSLIRT